MPEIKKRTTEERLDEIRGAFGWRLSETGAGSAKYGPCEVCGKHADTMYLQNLFHRFDLDDVDRASLGTTDTHGWSHRGGAFGHKECLLALREAQR